MEKISGIYSITNKINSKRYIGQTNNIYKRFKEHVYYVKNGTESRHLQFAYNKYGIDAFLFEIVELCPVDKLNEREIYWISYFDSYNNGYNLTTGGAGAKNVRLTQEQRKRISERLKGKPRSKEHCENLSKAKKEYFKTHRPPNEKKCCVVKHNGSF